MKVLLLSGYAEADLAELLAMPSTRFVAKPFAASVLMKAVAALFDPKLKRP